jgi:hypothetical protein
MNHAMFRYADDGVLRTAERGAEAYRDIVRGIASCGPDDPIGLDFAGVRAISIPFANESVCQLLAGWRGGYHAEHPLVVTDADREVRATLAGALRLHRLSVLAVADDQVELLGGDAILTETIEVARALGEFRVHDLAEHLNLKAPAANNRLRLLMRSGALIRTRSVPIGGGKEFLYRVPVGA